MVGCAICILHTNINHTYSGHSKTFIYSLENKRVVICHEKGLKNKTNTATRSTKSLRTGFFLKKKKPLLRPRESQTRNCVDAIEDSAENYYTPGWSQPYFCRCRMFVKWFRLRMLRSARERFSFRKLCRLATRQTFETVAEKVVPTV